MSFCGGVSGVSSHTVWLSLPSGTMSAINHFVILIFSSNNAKHLTHICKNVDMLLSLLNDE